MRRLRASGKIPAVLYGHGQDVKHLTLDAKELDAVVRHSGHVVTLQGDVVDNALVKKVQFDYYDQIVLHVDLFRVDVNEKVEIELDIALKGTAKGLTQGGTVSVGAQSITIMCPAFSIPDKLELKIGNLELNQMLRASDLTLPKGAELITPAETVLVQCVPIVEVPEEEPAEA
jgi:large subunit ribosomal protein L25